jgi:hypothetical protein
MKVLMIGDIMGEPGRRSVARLLPKLIANHSIDVVVGNGENVAADSVLLRTWWMICSISGCRSSPRESRVGQEGNPRGVSS